MSTTATQIDYEYRKRDLATKYSFAISRLGICAPADKERWQNELAKISQLQADLNAEYRK